MLDRATRLRMIQFIAESHRKAEALRLEASRLAATGEAALASEKANDATGWDLFAEVVRLNLARTGPVPSRSDAAAAAMRDLLSD